MSNCGFFWQQFIDLISQLKKKKITADPMSNPRTKRLN